METAGSLPFSCLLGLFECKLYNKTLLAQPQSLLQTDRTVLTQGCCTSTNKLTTALLGLRKFWCCEKKKSIKNSFMANSSSCPFLLISPCLSSLSLQSLIPSYSFLNWSPICFSLKKFFFCIRSVPFRLVFLLFGPQFPSLLPQFVYPFLLKRSRDAFTVVVWCELDWF